MRQNVEDALQGKSTGTIATGPLAVHYCAALEEVSIRRYTTDAQTLADSVIRYYERFRPDAVWLSADTWVSAQAMGAAVDFTADNQPMGGTGEPAVRTIDDVRRIPMPDPNGQGRYPMMLEALRRIVDAIGDRAYIVACFDQYPFSLAAALMGVDQIMLAIYDDRTLVESLMDRCREYAVAYARALGEAGADMLSGGDSPAGLIGPELYAELAMPAERQTIEEIKAGFNGPVSLHICGDATAISPVMDQAGADVLEIDQRVDLACAFQSVSPQTAIWGNLDPVALLAQGSVDDVKRETRRAIETFKASGHRRFVLSSGCTLAVETPPENLEAMLTVAKE